MIKGRCLLEHRGEAVDTTADERTENKRGTVTETLISVTRNSNRTIYLKGTNGRRITD